MLTCEKEWVNIEYASKHWCTLLQCIGFCVHVYIAKMSIMAYMSLGEHIHTINELTESNVGMDELLDHF